MPRILNIKKKFGYLFLSFAVLSVFFGALVSPVKAQSDVDIAFQNANKKAQESKKVEALGNAAIGTAKTNLQDSQSAAAGAQQQTSLLFQNAAANVAGVPNASAGTNNTGTILYTDPITGLPTTDSGARFNGTGTASNPTNEQIPTSATSPAGAGATESNQSAPALTQATVPQVTGLTCTWGQLAQGDLKGCFLTALEFFLVEIPAWIFSWAGAIFDTLVALSLSSAIIRNPTFVDAGWIISRDLANTFFIFILLFIALQTILQMAGGKTYRTLVTLIAVALLMNFSLYVTRFVIDVGNVVALEFYTKIGGNITPRITLEGLDIQPRGLSNGFANVFNIQNIMGPEVFSNLSSPGSVPLLGFVFVLIGAMLLVASYVFVSAGFLFLSRLVTFWLCMIFAPLAFFSWILPNLKAKIWSRWWTELVNASFVAPVFLFFIYLILGLGNSLQSSHLFNAAVSSRPGEQVFLQGITVFLNFFILIALLIAALKIAKGLTGAAGSSFASGGAAVVGTGLGLGFGTAAMTGRNLIGGGAKFMADRYGDRLNSAGFVGQLTNRALQGTAASSFDVRASKIAQTIDSSLGGVAGMKILGKPGGAGGFAKGVQEKQAEIQKTFNDMKGRDAVAAFKYLANQRKIVGTLPVGASVDEGRGVGGVMSGLRARPDENVLAIWKTLGTKERLDAIDKAEGDDKVYFQKLNQLLETGGAGFTPAQVKTEQKEQAKLILGKAIGGGATPEEKKKILGEKLDALKKTQGGTQEELYKSLSVSQRKELEEMDFSFMSGIRSRLSSDDERIILEAEHKYQDTEARKEKEARAAEMKTLFGEATPGQTFTDEQRTKIKGHVAKMDGRELSLLDEDILTHDEVIPHITKKALAKIEKENMLSRRGRNALYSKLKAFGSEEVKNYLNEDETIQAPKVYLPTMSFSSEKEAAKNTPK